MQPAFSAAVIGSLSICEAKPRVVDFISVKTSRTSGFEMQTSGSPLVSFLTEPEF